jgi:hypothetical protein
LAVTGGSGAASGGNPETSRAGSGSMPVGTKDLSIASISSPTWYYAYRRISAFTGGNMTPATDSTSRPVGHGGSGQPANIGGPGLVAIYELLP